MNQFEIETCEGICGGPSLNIIIDGINWIERVRQVDEASNTVSWSGFRNPFRKAWTYDGLGPFCFQLDA